MVTFIYIYLLLTTFYYGFVVLERWHDYYTPNYTWTTVVGGNGIILVAAGELYWISELSMRAFIHFFFLNLAAGIIIIIWQLVQNRRRRKERK